MKRPSLHNDAVAPFLALTDASTLRRPAGTAIGGKADVAGGGGGAAPRTTSKTATILIMLVVVAIAAARAWTIRTRWEMLNLAAETPVMAME